MATTPEGPGSNPYGAPLAPVSDSPSADARGLVERGRQLPALRGLEWYGEAWRLFRVAPGAWIGIWVLFAVCIMAASVFPLLGMFANALLSPIFLGILYPIVKARGLYWRDRYAAGEPKPAAAG